ncbi:hypothetical protein G6F50_014674 [Rhizopus delemar]|uniref:Uncharacterized protein n=1 Tax=Rhizopus delemar TaxID=936053 RepID=A0A9P6Y3B6_9FUNG|nr:hypothetical protein G6F50_014674 [Rhizopus delemar]
MPWFVMGALLGLALLSAALTWAARGYAVRQQLMDQPGERRSHSPAGYGGRGHGGLAARRAEPAGRQPWPGPGGRHRLVGRPQAPACPAPPAGAFHCGSAAGHAGQGQRWQLAAGRAGAAVHRLADLHLELHGWDQRHCRQPGDCCRIGTGAAAALALFACGPGIGPGLPGLPAVQFSAGADLHG